MPSRRRTFRIGRATAGTASLLVADIAAVVIVVVSTAVVVVGVLGLFVWAAIQDGRDEAERERRSGETKP